MIPIKQGRGLTAASFLRIQISMATWSSRQRACFASWMRSCGMSCPTSRGEAGSWRDMAIHAGFHLIRLRYAQPPSPQGEGFAAAVSWLPFVSRAPGAEKLFLQRLMRWLPVCATIGEAGCAIPKGSPFEGAPVQAGERVLHVRRRASWLLCCPQKRPSQSAEADSSPQGGAFW